VQYLQTGMFTRGFKNKDDIHYYIKDLTADELAFLKTLYEQHCPQKLNLKIAGQTLSLGSKWRALNSWDTLKNTAAAASTAAIYSVAKKNPLSASMYALGGGLFYLFTKTQYQWFKDQSYHGRYQEFDHLLGPSAVFQDRQAENNRLLHMPSIC